MTVIEASNVLYQEHQTIDSRSSQRGLSSPTS